MWRKANRKRGSFAESGFTLIELLVVISIIAVLLSLLLPSMSGARRTGQRIACSASLRRLAEGMGQYADMNDGWIVGSPSGSGAYLAGETQAWGPALQNWDFMGPLAELWGFGFTLPSRNGPPQDVITRFNQTRTHGAFLCPGNKFIAMWYLGVDAGAGWMVSYNTNRYQLLRRNQPGETGSSGTWLYMNDHEELLPRGWKPIADKMGVPANKIFCGDGARYSDCEQAPDYDLRQVAGWGGAFSDSEPFAGSTYYSQSWDRRRAPGNNYMAATDARVYAFRHSTGDPPVGAAGNAYKANFAFYDGHVETQGDLDASNPFQWLPDGSQLNNTNTLPDVQTKYGLSGTTLIGPEKPLD